MKTVIKSAFLIILSLTFIRQLCPAQEKPEWRFSIIASISDSTVSFYGGIENAKESVYAQIEKVNDNYNKMGVFDGMFNFTVDSFQTFSGSPTNLYSTALSGFDYQIVYDNFNSPLFNWVGPPKNTVVVQLPHSEGYPSVLDLRFAKAITHELGHARGAVDIYGLEVSSRYNEVNGRSYLPEVSVMSSSSDSIWDEHSINIINYFTNTILSTYQAARIKRFFASKIGVRIVGSIGEPIEDAEIVLYPHRWYDMALTDDMVLSGETDSNGVCIFEDNPYTIIGIVYAEVTPFNISLPLVLAIIKDGNRRHYSWMPFMDYQNSFFDGERDTTLLTLEIKTGSINDIDIFKYVQLSQNFPNPFNGRTDIRVNMRVETKVDINIYNILGQKMANLYSGTLGTGEHYFEWDASQSAIGIYFVALQVGDETDCRKMLLLK